MIKNDINSFSDEDIMLVIFRAGGSLGTGNIAKALYCDRGRTRVRLEAMKELGLVYDEPPHSNKHPWHLNPKMSDEISKSATPEPEEPEEPEDEPEEPELTQADEYVIDWIWAYGFNHENRYKDGESDLVDLLHDLLRCIDIHCDEEFREEDLDVKLSNLKGYIMSRGHDIISSAQIEITTPQPTVSPYTHSYSDGSLIL